MCATVQTEHRVRIRHPGYGNIPNSTLLSLPAVDCNVESSDSSQSFGLHHRTVLTAGAIIANNAFDRAYLTHDQAGRNPVTAPLGGLLEPGDYWLHLSGEEPPIPSVDLPGSGQRDGASAAVPDHGDGLSTSAEGLMPPPSRLRSSDSSVTCRTAQLPDYEPYPIVPSFGDWQFPHNRLPSEWKMPRSPPDQPPMPSSSQQTSLIHTSPVRNRCYLTDHRMSTNKRHLIPSEKSDWFGLNGMAEYTSSQTGTVDDEANIAILRADFHQLFDQCRFVIVPKPSAALPGQLSGHASSTSTTTPGLGTYAFAIHVLGDGEDTGEFTDLYQNVSIQTKYFDQISREFLFARFAWAIFPLLRSFLDTPIPRRIAVIVEEKNRNRPNHVSSDLWLPQSQWINNAQFTQHLHKRGESRTGSKKRRPSQMTRDADTDGEDDAYDERWERRSDSLNDGYADIADPDQRQLDEATRWYETHGRYAAVDFAPDDWEDDRKRGRPRHRKPELQPYHDDVDVWPDTGSNGDLEEVPTLSCSFTTTASNGSSARVDLPATEAPGSPPSSWRRSPDPAASPVINSKADTGAVLQDLA